MIKSSFGFAMPKFDPAHRLYANELAGGGILDVGCYPVSMARLIAGAAAGKPFLDPAKVAGVAQLGETRRRRVGRRRCCAFPNGIIAEVSCSVSLAAGERAAGARHRGADRGRDFWFACGHEGGVGRIEVIARKGAPRTVEVAEPGWLYSFEADAAARGDPRRPAGVRAPGHELGRHARQHARARQVAGRCRARLRHRARRGAAAHAPRTLPLERRVEAIPRRALAGLARPASVLALGFEDFPDFAGAAILLDAFFERGGNVLDTAWVYRSGRTEAVLGEWLRARGVRDEVVVIGKGAHSPLTYPEVIARQLTESLDRLGTDHVDVYFMHRDNPDVPVGEFVDAMDAEVRAGRIRGPFGGSNWTRERFDEAVAYAERAGKARPTALSNNFSLAEMLDPIWAGCVAASDDAWKAWLTERQVVNFAWSSQGRGFFTPAAGRDRRDNAELVRVWYSEKNFARRDRAIELAGRLGKRPIHVALAYCLAQPFPVLPLIGPRRLVELDDSLQALDIALTPEQVRWLESGEGAA